MLAAVAIVVNNYIVYPYLSLFGAKAVILELPDELWQLMKIEVGGYVVGRSAEKIAKVWRGGSVEKTSVVKLSGKASTEIAQFYATLVSTTALTLDFIR